PLSVTIGSSTVFTDNGQLSINDCESTMTAEGDPHAPSEHLAASAPHHDPHATPAGEQTWFSPTERQEFRDADKTAAAYIVVLMQGIFVVGLVLYLIVLWSVV